MIAITIIIAFAIAIPYAIYIGSGYTYQHNPETRKDLIEHL